MTFSTLSFYFQKLEAITSRNKMIEVLAELFSNASKEEIDKICYLLQGRVAPLFMPIEFGMADKMVIRSLSFASGQTIEEVNKLFKKLGDLGAVAEELAGKGNLSLFGKKKKINLTVSEVYKELYKVATASGEGSQDVKIKILATLLESLDSLSCRYIVRIPLGKMRLGFSDMTILDSLSWMLKKDKSARPEIEKAYNVRPDLGFIAKVVKAKGLGGLKEIKPEPGTPILMARAERLSSGKEIIEKIGKCAVEPKIDGFRVAVHKDGDKIFMFSRNLEDTTLMYPDLVAAVLKQVKAKRVIFEGEAVAYNTQTGEFLPFQETVQRKRKYEIEKMAKDIPLKLICFDCLYINGENLINKPYVERRKRLEKILSRGDRLILSEETIIDKPEDLEKLFNDAISRGLEGVMAKRLDGVYQAGARGFNWIKYKRSYAGKLEDTIDALVLGFDYGQGKRAGFGIGDFLIGVYDQKSDLYKTVAKIGTGLSDVEWKEMAKRLNRLKAKEKPPLYDVDKMMNCDVWVEPEVVVVIKADEITRSPVHTAGRTGKEPGYALRFPRLVQFRSDKKPEDATTVKEIIEMFKSQFK